jgi:hypothetical protein
VNVATGIVLAIAAVTTSAVAQAQDVPKDVGAAKVLPAETYAAKEEAAYAIGMQAYIWGYPLVEMYRVRDASTLGPDPAGVNAPINQFGHARRLVDEKLKLAHYPNSDTVYSLAWLDLTNEPQVLHVPDTKGRYYVVPLCSAYNEIFASLGSRTNGYGEKRYAIVGPNWQGELPPGVKQVRSPTNLVWVLIRTLGGAGANLPEDAIYPMGFVDADGKPLDGRNRYVLRFGKGQTPPVDAFWSLSMYGIDQNLVANSLNRFNIGDRNKGLKYGDDGSLTIYIQSERPPKEQEPNWLPAPADRFVLAMRAYAPRKSVLDLTYKWPPVQKVEEGAGGRALR